MVIMDITIVLPVKNEGKNLRLCIEAVSSLGYVLVVDSCSSDDTQAVAKAAGAEVLNFEWDGQFPKKRNWTLRNYDFKTEWVLFLDADEFVSPQFVTEVQAAVADTSHVGYRLHFSNYFMGEELKHGDRMCKLALFRIGAGEYEEIKEDSWSHLDMEIHEHPVLQGTIGDIQTTIEHNDYRGLKHYIGKHNEYASWEAARFLWLLKHQGAEWEGLTDRQKKKYRSIDKWWFAPAYFLISYVLKKGFLDGAGGFHFALMKLFYFYQIRLKILEHRNAS